MSDSPTTSPPSTPARRGWTLERAAAEPGSGLHPLAGADFSTFLRQYFRHGEYSARSRKQRILTWIIQGARWPFSAWEQLRWGRRIREHRLDKPPIFLIGHWRSGTTHLHNLLSRDPQFGYIDFGGTAMPWDMLGAFGQAGREAVRRVLPETRGYDNVKLSLEEPQEEEMALGNMNPLGFYNIYYFPRQMDDHARRALFFDGVTARERERFEDAYRFLVKKLSVAKGGRQLLFKNPPSTARIPLIKKLFPEAKFVHIVRNPYPVYRSNIGKFARLYNAFAWQDFQDVKLSRFTIDLYEELMRRYLADRETLGAGDLFETTYEAITADPLGEIGRIYDALGIGDKETGLGKIAAYVETIRGYQKNVHKISAREAAEIQERWRFSFDHWGYPLHPPEEIEIAD